MLICTAITGCGGSQSSTPKFVSSRHVPAANTGLVTCARTFEAIITGANPYADPAWVNYFLPQNQTHGLPVAIGEDASLTEQGSGGVCALTFRDPTEQGVFLATALFMPAQSSFNGSSNAPVLEPTQGTAPPPNVQLGDYGAMTYLADGSPLTIPPRPPTTPTATNPPQTETSTSTIPPASVSDIGASPCGYVPPRPGARGINYLKGVGVDCATVRKVVVAAGFCGRTLTCSVDGYTCKVGTAEGGVDATLSCSNPQGDKLIANTAGSPA